MARSRGFPWPCRRGSALEIGRATSSRTRERAQSVWSPLSLKLPDAQMRSLHRALLQELAVELPDSPTQRYQPLSWEQIRDLAAAGIEIGAHTQTHPCLSRISSERLHDEIAGSKRRLETMLGAEVLSFCYPNGTPDDLNDEVKRVVREAGIPFGAGCLFRCQGHGRYLRAAPLSGRFMAAQFSTGGARRRTVVGTQESFCMTVPPGIRFAPVVSGRPRIFG